MLNRILGGSNMRKKGISVLLLTAAITAGAISICTAIPDKAPVPGLEAPVVTVQAASAPSASKLAKAVKKAYGDDYLPNYKLGKAEIKDKYGVASSLYSSAYAEVPMISAQVDELVVFKAKNSASKKKIVSAVKEYQKNLKENSLQYPMNVLKVQASKVYTNGKYVCFFMLGGYVDTDLADNGSDEEIIKEYQKLNNIAVKAVKNSLK